jgi:single-strand DNA-binding protein
MNLNKVMLIGRLGKKPEVNYVQPDVPVARFSLATSEYYKSKEGDKIENTEWHNIVSWRNNAKFAESYLDKGMLVYIEGKLQTRKWDAQDGTTRYSTEIVTDQIKILEKREGRENAQYEQRTTSSATAPATSPAATTASAPATTSAVNTTPDESFEIDDLLGKSDVDDDLPF